MVAWLLIGGTLVVELCFIVFIMTCHSDRPVREDIGYAYHLVSEDYVDENTSLLQVETH